MEVEDVEVVQMELKYCERCGGLWLRVRGSGEIHCPGCAEQLAWPLGRQRKAVRLPLSVNRRLGLKKVHGEEQAWLLPSAEGGNA